MTPNVSVFPYRVFCINCPSEFHYESEKYADWYNQISERKFGNWASLRRLSSKLFCHYFGYQAQYDKNHKEWTEKIKDVDVVITRQNIKHNISFKPKKPFSNESLLEPFSYNFYRNQKKDTDIDYVCTLFWFPVMIYVGWISSSELEFGKSSLLIEDLHPIETHPVIPNLKELKYI